MRAIAVLALAVTVALAAASAIPERTRKVADKELLTKQKNILQLLVRVHQPTYLPEMQAIARSFEPRKNLDHFQDWAQASLEKLLARHEEGRLLDRGHVFSPVYKKHIRDAVLLFEVLYGAKDYDTFYKTAVWLREHVNQGQFVYALCIAVIHREDTHDIVLPPPYEIYPELFLSAQVLQKAVQAKLQGHLGQTFTINAAHVDNSSAWWPAHPHVQHPDDLLKYFTEDVGLSAYQTYLHYEYPYWFSAHKYGDKPAPRRGEVFYYTLQQIASRYYLERLSNGLTDIEPATADLHEEHLEGYAPHLRYFNGLAMPSRPEGLTVSNIDLFDVEIVRKVEHRLQNAIDLGVAFDTTLNKVALTDKDGIDILGNMISGNKDSIHKKYYGNIYMYLRLLYGHINDPEHEHGVAPSVLEHFETAMRDPVYYRIVERVLKLFHQYKNMLTSYTRDELIFPGINIENVETDKLVTFVDEHVFDVNAFLGVASEEEAQKVDVRVRQPRLNHKPFSVRVTVDSDKNTRVGVRFFLAPKYDYLGNELSFEDSRQHAVELDRFFYDLKSGKNTIERSSRDSNAIVPDQTLTRVLLKKVEDGLQGREPFYVDASHRHCGFPERLLLPKGSRQGSPFTLFVAISPFSGDSVEAHRAYVTCGAGFGYQQLDNKPLGFPLDRVIRCDEEFMVPNFYAKEVIVFHKKQEDFTKA